MSDVVDAEVVADNGDVGQELVPATTSNLFHTDDPALVLKRAQETANALMPVVRTQNLVVKIQGRDHLTVEAWQTLGAMLGVTPVCVWTHELDNGWEARVEARTLDGRVIGAAEAECLRSESTWAKRDDFALRSMAQTRATSKALASVLRFVATLGGASGTPAEEMPRDGGSGPSGGGEATTPQKSYVTRLFNGASLSESARKAAIEWAGGLTKAGASKLIESLKDDPTGKKLMAQVPGQSDIPADTSDFEPADRPAEAVDEPDIPF